MGNFYVAAHALVQDNEGRVLVMKRAACNDYMPLTWDIPGGTVELGETVEQALVRELKEETGINIVPLNPVYAYTNLSQLPKRQTVQLVYRCRYISGEVKLNPEEHEDYKWTEYSCIDKLDCIAFLKGLIKNYDM